MNQRVSKYHRQILLPQIGEAGQVALQEARVLVVGCGALGCGVIDLLARAGVGFLRIVDRDLVQPTNLHRQSLYTQADADDARPKAVAAAVRVRAVNPDITVEEAVADVHARNLTSFADNTTLIVDALDNAQTRYILNDFACTTGTPWIYGGAVGVEGRVMAIIPGQTPCLRCLFPTPPAPAELPTCDTVGVLNAATALVSALQASLAIRVLTGDTPQELIRVDAWTCQFRTIDVSDARDSSCPCCVKGEYPYLEAPQTPAQLCGRNAVQVHPATAKVDLHQLADRLKPLLKASPGKYLLRFSPEPGIEISVFPDGRAIVEGSSDPAHARALYDRYIGS